MSPSRSHSRLFFALAAATPESVVLLGAQPSGPEVEYGWIEVGEAFAPPHAGAFQVRGFQEKPPLLLAQNLFQSGSLWNTFVMVGYARAFLDLAFAFVPTLTEILASTQVNPGRGAETRIAGAVYHWIGTTDFSRQVLAPQVDAVVYAVEDLVATALKGVTLTLMGAGNPLPTYSAADPVAMLTAIRKLLRDRGVPTSGLNLVVGTQVYADLLSTAKIMDVSQSASTAALREGNVGSVRGFTVVESTRVDDGEIIAFHRDAFTLAVRAPIVPAGASFGQSLSERGFSLRYLRDYDAVHTVDRSIVSTFAGVAALPFKSVNRSTGALTDVVPAIHVQAIA